MHGLVNHFVLGAHYSLAFEKLLFFSLSLFISLFFALYAMHIAQHCSAHENLRLIVCEGECEKLHWLILFEKLGSLSLFLSSRHKTALFF